MGSRKSEIHRLIPFPFFRSEWRLAKLSKTARGYENLVASLSWKK
jgi:hypothetical protein